MIPTPINTLLIEMRETTVEWSRSKLSGLTVQAITKRFLIPAQSFWIQHWEHWEQHWEGVEH